MKRNSRRDSKANDEWRRDVAADVHLVELKARDLTQVWLEAICLTRANGLSDHTLTPQVQMTVSKGRTGQAWSTAVMRRIAWTNAFQVSRWRARTRRGA
jgi:hypothetical protein